MDTREILAGAELLNGIGDEALNKILDAGRTTALNRAGMLFMEEEPGSAFYVLIAGAVKLYKLTAEGKEVIVKLVRPGEMFAEVILFESDRYPVTAEAIEDSSVFEISRDLFLDLLDDEGFRNEFIASLMRKHRYLTKRLLYLTSYDVEERFFRFLIERQGRKSEYTIRLSKKDIASAIGTIPETFSRLIQRLKDRGEIRWEKRTLSLKEGFWENSPYYED